MIFGTGSLPDCILAVALEEALLCELVIVSHSSGEGGHLGGELLEMVTHLYPHGVIQITPTAGVSLGNFHFFGHI